jgi:hypothetical protein
MSTISCACPLWELRNVDRRAVWSHSWKRNCLWGSPVGLKFQLSCVLLNVYRHRWHSHTCQSGPLVSDSCQNLWMREAWRPTNCIYQNCLIGLLRNLTNFLGGEASLTHSAPAPTAGLSPLKAHMHPILAVMNPRISDRINGPDATTEK